MSRIEGYVVLNREGKLRRSYKGAPGFHVKLTTAKNVAKHDGDSIVPVFVDLDVEPVFIRSKTV